MKNFFSSQDQTLMQVALEEAKKAFLLGEVPVGAVLAKKGQIIARAFNTVEEKQNPTAHAELLCIQRGAKNIGNWRLLDMVLYTTLEPCVMCGGAILLSRLKKVIWAAPDIRHGSHGSWINIFKKKHPTHSLEIVGGLCQEEAAHLMRFFFKKQRKKDLSKVERKTHSLSCGM